MSALIIPHDIRERHTYIIGRSRYGKTNLVKNLIIQTMEQGAFGLSFLDVHGDAAEQLIGNAPPHRVHDVVYWDPSEPHSPAFNIFAVPYAPDKLTNDIVGFLKHLHSSNWGQQMDYILRHSIYTLVTDMRDHGVPHSFKDVERFLKDVRYRNQIVNRSTRASERMFWAVEFPRFSKNALMPIFNRISRFFLSGSLTERIFSEEENDLDIPVIMNTGKFLIANLARGNLGKDYSAFLGSVLMQGIVEAAFARAKQYPDDRRVHHLFVDEFQEFLDSPFGDILSQTGKYKLALTMSHQHTGQLRTSPGLEEDIFANVTTVVAFRVKPKDAVKMTQVMQGKRTTYRWYGQSKYHPIEQLPPFLKEHFAKALQECEPKPAPLLTPVGKLRDFRPPSGSPHRVVANRIGTNPTPYQAELEWAYKTVTDPEITAEALKDIVSHNYTNPWDEKREERFHPISFKEDNIPSVNDLLNLPRFKAFCQVDRADTVKKFRTRPAPEPNPELAQAVHAANKQRYEERLARRKLDATQQPLSPPDDDHDPDDDL
jgi:hypothetical protein